MFQKQRLFVIILLVEHTGVEPVTSTLPVWRATNCANTPKGATALQK